MTTLYYSTGSCSIGIRIILEEIGLSFDSIPIDLAAREQFSETFASVNSKRKVPALIREDRSLLTEFPAIAFWLARSHMSADLIPEDLEGQTRVLEALDFMVGSVHMRGFTFIIVPMKFSTSKETQQELVAHGRAQVDLGMARLGKTLGDRDWLLGDYSIADACLFFLTYWAKREKIDLPDNLIAWHERMMARESVLRAFDGESLEKL
ncbi:MAG: glutathione S-transferase family protein [Rhizobiaceae bacterium]|nr:glutathione S-transferase family protein [Rhizobiaceae bacterium]